MSYDVGKTEHAGPKRGAGAYWGRKQFAKRGSNKRRRAEGRALSVVEL